MSRTTVIVFVALLSLLAPSYADSDRGIKCGVPLLKSSQPNQRVSEPNQEAILAWNGKEQIILARTRIKAPGNRRVLLIFPLPAKPAVNQGQLEAFNKVTNLINQKTNPKKRNLVHQRVSDMDRRKGPDIQKDVPAGRITQRQTIGNHDLSVINVKNKAGFVEWVVNTMKLAGENDPEVSDAAQEIISDYLRNGFSWFVFDVVELNEEGVFDDAIEFKFPTTSLFYPLRISSIGKGYTRIDLVVISPKLMKDFTGIPVSSLKTLHEPLETNTSELEAISENIAGLFGHTKTKMRTWRIEGDMSSFRNDLMASSGQIDEANTDSSMGEPTKANWTPLILELANEGRLDEALNLVKSGAELREKDAGWKMINMAVKYRNMEAAKFLLEKGVDPLIPPSVFKNQRLSGKAANELEKSVFLGDLTRMFALIENGSVIDLRTFQYAMKGQHLEILTALLDFGSQDLKDQVLMEMAREGNTDGLKLLLAKGADPNAGINERKAEKSPLKEAVSSGNLEIVKLLLEKGADPNYGDPIVQAAHSSRIDMVRLLRSNGANEESLRNSVFGLIQMGKIEDVRNILAEGIQVDKEKALDTAASYGKTRIAEILVEQGADVNKGTPLVWAATSGNLETVIFFLNRGADIHKKDQFGRTALGCADSGGFSEIKALLIDRGARE